jgi:hypothetical protein
LSVKYESVKYESVKYESVKYESVKYESVKYESVKYESVKYESVKYESVKYESVICPIWSFVHKCVLVGQMSIGQKPCRSESHRSITSAPRLVVANPPEAEFLVR